MRGLVLPLAGLALWSMCVGAAAQNGLGTTERVSVATSGEQGNGAGGSGFPSLGADGRYVAFYSMASNLVPGDTNSVGDAFIRDRLAGTTERVSVGTSGEQGSNYSVWPSLSPDGRFVAFGSTAEDLVPGDMNKRPDIFVRDRRAGTTELVSVGTGGTSANGGNNRPDISADGRFVSFTSDATNLVPGDTNGVMDVFVRDRLVATTERVSVASSEEQSDRPSTAAFDHPAMSADGRFVAFSSEATNLVPGDTNGVMDVFVRDRLAGMTECVSLGIGGVNGDSGSARPALSADGRYVAFFSDASNLVPDDTNGVRDVFVRDRLTGSTERVSIASSGEQGNLGASDYEPPALSADGRFVAFESQATNLVTSDTNGEMDVFLRDRLAGTTERVSVGISGMHGDNWSNWPSLSADGRFVAFVSLASNLVPGDTNHTTDVFIRDRRPVVRPAKAGMVTLKPNPPRAGQVLSATMPISAGGKPVASAAITCTARIVGKQLRDTGRRSYRAGVARCTWTLPLSSRGKTIRGSIRAATPDGRVARSFHARIRPA
jgi:Tol biopolymer transport system component